MTDQPGELEDLIDLSFEVADEDELVENLEDGDFFEGMTPRQIKRHKFQQTLKDLKKLASALPRLNAADRSAAMKIFEDAEKTGCELSLATFYKCAWPHLDPAPYKHNWHVDATAEQAEKLITGETRRLIVNQPPRTGKSNLLSVVFPLWVWIQSERGPMSGPQVKFLCASYGQSLSLKHSGDMRKLISSPWFQKHWGTAFKLLDDRNAVGFFENDRGGYRMSTSVGAGLTGQGGDCVLAGTFVNTPSGRVRIEDLKIGDQVYGFDISQDKVVTSRVLAQRSLVKKGLYEIRTSFGNSLFCTADHPIFVPGRGYVEASKLGCGDRIVVTGGARRRHSPPVLRVRTTSAEDTLPSTEIVETRGVRQLLRSALRLRTPREKTRASLFTLWRTKLSAAFSLLHVGLRRGNEERAPTNKEGKILSRLRRCFLQNNDLLHPPMRRLGALTTDDGFTESQIQKAREIFEPVQISDTFHPNQRSAPMCGLSETGLQGSDRQDSKTLGSGGTSYRREHTEQSTGESHSFVPVVPQETPPWEIETVLEVCSGSEGSYEFYDIQVEGCCNFFANDILVHNCILIDDPHNTQDVVSEAERTAAINWYSQSLVTRLNDPKTGVMLLVMQRQHEEDLTGYLMENEPEFWEHFVLRMRYEINPFLEYDPRGYDENGEILEDLASAEGTLLWPERIPENEVAKMEKTLGTYGCTPAESPVLMADLTLKPISEVKAGDEVAGFTTDTENGTARRSLKKSTVKRTFSYVAPVVKITLDTLETIRCTADHKWFMGKGGAGSKENRPMYRPAKIGRSLIRVCPPRLPNLTPEQERMAGWLGGFFDGEGSATNCEKRKQIRPNGERFPPSVQLSFYQTADKNLPVCEELERCLKEFGFTYNLYRGKNPVDKPHWQEKRHYQLNDMGPQGIQKFLHIVKPVKWKERITEGAYRSKFSTGKEKIISIEPDGVEPVYALETTTGNYVVWGLASSNSEGQLQQRPSPKGGGIIKVEHWKMFPPEGQEEEWKRDGVICWPPVEYVVASLDGAYTEREENDPSGFTVWGLWYDKLGLPKVIAMHAWEDFLSFNPLVMRVGNNCRKFKVDVLLIEAKASGISAAQEIQRVFGASEWTTILVNPKGDKVARAISVQGIWEEGTIMAPDRAWAQLLIDRFAQFPKGKRKDIVDSGTQAIRWMRDNGLIKRRDERMREVHDALPRPGASLADAPPYDV